jgi:hypothetical protein
VRLGQIRGEPGQERLAVAGPGPAALLVLDDPTADLPVRGGQDRVDRPRRRPPRGVEHRADPGHEPAVIVREAARRDLARFGGFLLRHGAQE